MKNIKCIQCNGTILIDNSYAVVWSHELSNNTCSKECCENIENVLNGYMYNCFLYDDIAKFNINDINQYIKKWEINKMINPVNNKKNMSLDVKKECVNTYNNYIKMKNAYEYYFMNFDFLKHRDLLKESIKTRIVENERIVDKYKNTDEYVVYSRNCSKEKKLLNNVHFSINSANECICAQCTNKCICYEYYLQNYLPNKISHYAITCINCVWTIGLETEFMAHMDYNICYLCDERVSGYLNTSYFIDNTICHIQCYADQIKPDVESIKLYGFNRYEKKWEEMINCNYCNEHCVPKDKLNDCFNPIYHKTCYDKMEKKANYKYDKFRYYEEIKMTKNEIRYAKIKFEREQLKYRNYIIEEMLKNKIKIYRLKFTYGQKYKYRHIVDVYNQDISYIQWVIAHNLELDTWRKFNEHGGWSKKKISKKKKVESDVTKTFRYILGIPKHPCDINKCTNYAMYGDEQNLPYRCDQHKKSIHKIVLRTECRGIDGVCAFGCINGNMKYDNFCTNCFIYLFPTDPRVKTIRAKTKEIQVVNHVCLTHKGEWYHDIPLYVNFEDGCCPTKRRIDLRQMFGNTMLCIEVDENQHKYYTEGDDFVRYNEILCDLTCKYIFIRYNPDKYKVNGKLKDIPLVKRMEVLDKTITDQIDRINNNDNVDLLEIVHLFYDE